MRKSQRFSLILGVCAGVAYGLIAWFAFGAAQALPSMSFLLGVPFGMGACSLAFTDDAQVRWFQRLLLIPWLVIFLFFMLLVAVAHEAAACILVLALPLIFAVMLGTVIPWAIGAHRLSAKKKAAATAALLLLPFLFMPLEKAHLMPAEQGEALSSIVVDAPAAFIFDHLAEVPTINEGEYQPGLFNRLGIPRPIRATVDRAALGGLRVGEFEHGLRFDEVITRFDPPKRMAFSIAVDPSPLRQGSTERHALEAGYFRFLDATYALEPLGPGRTLLKLSSRFVLKSGWNSYGRFWASALVGDFQERVLAVLKRRCEAPAGALAVSGP